MKRLILALVCSSAAAATLTENVTCTVYLRGVETTQSGTTCNVVAPIELPLFSSGSVSLAAAYGSVTGSINGAVKVPFVPGWGEFLGNFTYTDTILADGPTRAGFLSYDAGISTLRPYVGNGGGSILLGTYASVFNGGDAFAGRKETIPVTLGDPFKLTVNGDASMSAENIDGGSSGGMRLSLLYSFLEADGVTPVTMREFTPNAINPTPEPGTWGLMLAAMLTSLIFCPSVFRCKQSN